ncbi:MAG: efflux RND transporter periplasmic adaptor subunit [Acidobacteriaceae bacterium]
MSLPSAHDRDLDSRPAQPRPEGSSATVTDPAHLLAAHSTEPPATGSWLRKIIVLVIILGVIAFVVWRIQSNAAETAATNNKTASAANRPTPVLVSAVQQKTVPVYLTALGTVIPYNTVTVHSRVDGQLLKVNFQEGQTVKQGQLLLQIDPRPYQAAVDQAVGTLTKDQANLRNTEAEAQRYTALYQAGVVSKESQQTQLSNAGQAAGSIKADQATIEAAKVNLSYTSIYSPINGVVGLRAVDPGNIVHSSDANGLVVITQIHPIAVIFTLPEEQLPQVQQAMRGAKLVVEAYGRNDSHKIAAGTLLTIDNQIDTTTGTAKLKAVFDNTDGSLFPNQFVNVRLILRDRPNATVIPSAAIQSGTQGNFVFVVHAGAGSGGGHKGGGQPPSSAHTASPGGDASNASGPADNGPKYHVDQVVVHVDFAQGSNSILTDGELQPGDEVVIDGQEKLNDGSNVQPTKPQQATPPSAKAIGDSGPNTPRPAGGPLPGLQPGHRRGGGTGTGNPVAPDGGGDPQ